MQIYRLRQTLHTAAVIQYVYTYSIVNVYNTRNGRDVSFMS